MKLGIVGVGSVGAAVTIAACVRGVARDIVLVDKDEMRAKGVATDVRYGTPLSPETDVRAASFDELAGSSLVVLAAGINEKAGGATNRNDPLGRLRLLNTNASIFEEIVPRVVAAAPHATLLVVTNPPEPLVDLSRRLAGHNHVLSTSTFLDSLRFRFHLAKFFGVSPSSVEANVVGEHGTFSVFLWSSAAVGGRPLLDLLADRHIPFDDFRQSIEQEVRFANISIIEGIGASQYGIGMVVARVAECILRDERAVMPAGSYQQRYGVTLSLPSIVGRAGVEHAFWPMMSDEEQRGVIASAERLAGVVQQLAGAA